MINELFIQLDEKDVKYHRNLPIKNISSVKIGAEADAVVYPETIAELIYAVDLCEHLNIKYKVVGNMTNILPTDNRYCGAIIRTGALNRYSYDGKSVRCECGASFSSLILRLARLEIGGAEALFGIPGTIGGMIYQNAGAFGCEISDFFVDALVYSPKDKQIFSLGKSDMKFTYRKSMLAYENMILLTATLAFKKKSYGEIISDVNNVKEKRIKGQPHALPSLGCVFKRCDGVSAAYYIDKAGLKGYSVNGAEISKKHAGFIVNKGGAKYEDFSAVIEHARQIVYQKFGVSIECEIEILL